jgi:hypothetical protein
VDAELSEHQSSIAHDVSFNTFWTKLVMKRHDGLSVIANGQHYRIAPESAEGMRGFGGAKWLVQFLDGRGDVQTSNLWHQGAVPEQFRRFLPDNATLISIYDDTPLFDNLTQATEGGDQ